MKISIITVTYNSGATLEECILSVMGQNFGNVEFIVIDGGSTDNTSGIIAKYREKIAHYVSERDSGLYDALNKGIAIATGDVIGILHSDDLFMNSEVISRYAEMFRINSCDAVYSDLYYVDRSDTRKVVRKWKSGRYRTGSFINGWMPPHPTLFIRTEVYRKYGNFNLSLNISADYELMLRMIHRHNIRLCYLPEFTVKMRVGGKSNVSIRNRVSANLQDRKAWKINGLSPRFYTLWLKPLRKIFQFF